MALARVRLNQAELDRLLRGRQGPVVQHVEILTRRTLNQAKRNARVDEGTLRSTLYHTITPSTGEVRGRVASPLDYAWYVHDGTGVYGPRGRPIRPVHAKVLRFELKGGRGVVYARSVKGIKGDKFLLRALESVVPYPITVNKK